jgi:hypothetical protein
MTSVNTVPVWTRRDTSEWDIPMWKQGYQKPGYVF